MNIHKLQIGFFIVLVTLISLLAFFVFKPFFSVLFIAMVFAIIFNPLHEKMLKSFGGKKALSSIVTVLIVLVAIVIPLFFLGALLFDQSIELYDKISETTNATIVNDLALKIESIVQRFIPGLSLEVTSYFDIRQYADQILGWAVDNFGTVFSSFFRLIFLFFILVLGLFYFFRDGDRFIEAAKKLSPLINTYDEQIFHKIALAVNSVIRGNLVIALIQGILTGLGLFIFGVPSPVIWGFIAAIASFIPSIGTAFVTGPAIIYLLLTGNTWQAGGLLIWAIVFVGLIDNLLGPVLIERGVNIHPFMILISVLGGIQLFGIIGFIAGPVVLALLFALLDIYPLLLHKATHNQGDTHTSLQV